MSEIKTQPIQQFLNELASKSATPGGGSAAAIMGAQGAALISMVCNLTIGKPTFADVEAEMQTLLVQAEDLRQQLTDCIQADVDVFNRVMAAYGLPKDTDADKAARSAAIQSVMKEATDVPLDCARACAKVIELSKLAADKGNPNVISDAGAAVVSAYGGLKTAALNVYINAGSLKDRDFADAKLAELSIIMQNSESATESLYQMIKAKL
ncbi:MAG: methenyltetrahydrofolate cyclohydrolase [Methylococcales bacterium]|nr:methenyltetrahydrofolate cyclohydrolase [Methylococcales bacterium]